MAYDGKLQFNTAIDTAGFLKGIENIGSIAKSGIGTIGNFAQTGIQGIISLSASSAEAIGKSIDIATEGMKWLGEQALNLSKQAVEMGKSFESSMSQVIATMGFAKDSMVEITNADGTTSMANAYDMLSQKAKEMGATTQFSASQAADALNYLALAGYDAQKACEALPAVLDLAAAGDMDLGYASDLATDAMSALNMEASTENLTRFGDSLAKTASRANTNVAQLGEAILVCGGQATLANMDLTQMNTALGILADNGIKGSEGGTALRNVLKNLYTPTQNAAEAMEKLGIVTSDINTGELLPVQDVLEQIGTALNNLNDDSAKMNYMSDIFDTRTIAAANALLNNYGERWNELSGEIESCDGAMAQMAETMNDNLKGDLKIWDSALEGLGITFYENVVGSLRETVQEATMWIGQLDEAFKADGFNGLATAAGDVLGSMIENMFHQLPHILKVGNEFIENLYLSIREQEGQIKYMGASIITDLIDSFTENFDVFYTTGFWIADTLLSGLSRKSDKLSAFAIDFIDTITGNITDFVPSLFESGAKIITSVAKGITEQSPYFIARISETLRDVLNTINSNLPELLKAGIKIIGQIMAGIRKDSKEISAQASGIITSLAEFLLENIPTLLAAGLTIAESLLDGILNGANEIQPAAMKFLEEIGVVIAEHLPDLLETGFSIIMTLIQGITDSIPEIVDTAVYILLSLAEFISDNIDLLIDAAILIITTLAEQLITEENLKKIISAAMDILNGVADGIEKNLPLLIECASQIIGEIMRYVNDEENRQEIYSGAGEIIGKLVKGLIDSLDEVRDFVAMLLVELGIAIAETDWQKLGKDIADGIMEGLLGVPFDSQEFKENFADNWVSGMKDIFGINSPSKLMRDEIGIYLVPGIAEGVSETAGQLTDEMNSAVNDAIDNIDTRKSVEFDISADTLTDFSEIEKLSARMESAVMEQQMRYAPVMNMQSELNISAEIKSAFEEALNNAELDGDTYLNVNIGQERIESIVISAMEKYNARTGGRY